MYDIIILGSGVAGLTAGLYAARGGAKAVVLEKNAPGGQLLLTESIENYPGFDYVGGPELGQKMVAHAQKFGVEIKYEGAENIELLDDKVVVKTKENTYEAKYIIVGVGSNPRKLGVPGEEEGIGKGVSYCATCDGAFYKDMPCVIVGGGDSALDEGIALTKHASKVTIIHRGEEFRAEKYMIDLAEKNEKIEFMFNHEVKEVRFGEDGKVDRVLLYNNKEDKESEFPTKGVFIFIGYLPNSKILEGKVDMDRGEIIVDLSMKSSHPRLYAAGDIRKGAVKQVIASGGDGAIAAIKVMEELRKEG